MNNFCVYKHTSPDGRVYIGMTGQKPEVRWQSGTGYKTNTYFTRSINKYGWQNFKHEIIAQGLSKEQAQKLEIRLIAEYKSNDRKCGFNISVGGESHKGVKISEWHKERVRQANIGKTVSQETREKLSAASKKTWSDPAHIERICQLNIGEKNPQYGKKKTDEEKLKRGAKQVLQFDIGGEFLAEYISLHNASEKTGVPRGDIKKCCDGIFKQAGGYVWEFKNK